MLDASPALVDAAPAPATRRRVLVAGAGGALGAAVVEQLLGGAGFAQVAALATQPIAPALRGFVALGADDDAAWSAFGADTALVVFERERGRHGREAALLRPQPPGLVALAQRLRAAGVRVLIVVVPHAAGLLPLALQHGLSTLDEAAVAAAGFDHLVFMRMARGDGGSAPGASPLQRLAHWMLSQLHWMVPQREQPVRVETVARVAAALALQLPDAAPGTRIWPAAWLGHAAQSRDAAAIVARWVAA
jgi:hypothetical protein